MVKNLPDNTEDIRDVASIPGSGRSPGEGNGNLFQYSCLENSKDRRAWQATVPGITKESDTTEQLTHTHTHAHTHTHTHTHTASPEQEVFWEQGFIITHPLPESVSYFGGCQKPWILVKAREFSLRMDVPLEISWVGVSCQGWQGSWQLEKEGGPGRRGEGCSCRIGMAPRPRNSQVNQACVSKPPGASGRQMRLGFQQKQHAQSDWCDWNQLAHLQSPVPWPCISHHGLWEVFGFMFQEMWPLDQVVMKSRREGGRKNAKHIVSFGGSLVWIHRKRSSLFSGWVGLSPWKGAVVLGRSDHTCTSFQPLVLVFHGSFSLMSAEHSTHRATWVSSERTVFPLPWDPCCRFTMGSPLSLQQIPCHNVSFSSHFREIFISLKNQSASHSPLTIRIRKLGIISLFALVDRKLGVDPEPHYCQHVCMCGQAGVSPSSTGLSFSVYFAVSFVSCLKVGEISVLPSLSFHDFFTQKANFCSYFIKLLSSATQSCPTLCNPMDCSMPGLPVHHQLLELAQTHVHQVRDALQPSPLLSPSPPAFNFSKPQGLFQ